VKFHDGEGFNADTVLFNLDRMFRRNLDRRVKDVPPARSSTRLPYVSRWERSTTYGARAHEEPAPRLGHPGREPSSEGVDDQAGVDALNERPSAGRLEARGWRRKTSMVLERNALLGPAALVKRLRLQVSRGAARLAALRAGRSPS